MNISIPWNLIYRAMRWLWNKITCLWLYETYRQSHDNYLNRSRPVWCSLCEHVDYSLRLVEPADSSSQKSRIAFRATKGKLEELRLFFEASGDGVRYIQRIEIPDLDENVVVITLDQIPRLYFIDSIDTCPRLINEIQLTHCVVTFPRGDKTEQFDTLSIFPTHNWLNDTWENRWGNLWNCNDIRFAKYEVLMYWTWHIMGYSSGICYRSSPLLNKSAPGFNLRLRQLFCKILTHPYMLTLLFWVAFHSGRFHFKDGQLVKKHIR